MGSANEPSTGLYDFHARTYDPKNGRFLSKDPIKGLKGKPQALNPYSYGANGPLAHPDPSGLSGFGFIGTFLAELGTGSDYSAAQGSLGGGYFSDTDPTLSSDAGFFESLGTADSPGEGYPSGSSDNAIYGGFLGASGGVFYSPNANTLSDISGPFEVDNYSAGIGGYSASFQHAYGENANGDPIDVYSFTPFGPGVGASYSHYSTNTATQETAGYNNTSGDTSGDNTSGDTSSENGGDSYLNGG